MRIIKPYLTRQQMEVIEFKCKMILDDYEGDLCITQDYKFGGRQAEVILRVWVTDEDLEVSKIYFIAQPELYGENRSEVLCEVAVILCKGVPEKINEMLNNVT